MPGLANALSLLQMYPEVPGLASQLARLAKEECAHLARVLALLGDSPGLIDVARSWMQLLRPGVLSAPPLVIR